MPFPPPNNYFKEGLYMMHKIGFNKYLKNIGITEDKYWVYNDEAKDFDPRYQPDEDGFIEADAWNLNITLAMINYSYLCYFRDHCLHCYPPNISFEQWKHYIDAMIKAFELILTEEEFDCSVSQEERMKASKNRWKQIRFGLKLYAKYFCDLWW